MIPTNPADKIDRLKKDKFVGSFYDSSEVNELFSHLEGHPLEVPIRLGASYGLRRSEILYLIIVATREMVYHYQGEYQVSH